MTKTIVACALFAVMLVSGVTGTHTRVEGLQPAYPIVCRGGGNLHFNYTPFSNLSPQPQIWITFERASGAVGAKWENLGVLQPGQCAWLDRPVAPDEPNQIALLEVERFAIQWQRGQVTGIGSELTAINVLQNANRYQSFEVTRSGNDFFVVRRIAESR